MANPVPPLPDADRLTEYNPVTATVGPFDVGFALFFTGSDYDSALQIWHDGELTVPVTDWVLTSQSGADLAVLPRPLTDAQITFTSARSGEIIIVGAQRPRRISQAAEGIGITARDHNRVITELMAIAREHNEKLGRAIVALPGDETVSLADVYDYAGGALPAAQEARDIAVEAAADAAADAAELRALLAANGNLMYSTRAAATAATVPGNVQALVLLGYASVGDCEMLLPFKKTVSTPAHSEWFTSADGAKWELMNIPGLRFEAFGCTASGDQTAYFRRMSSYINALGGGVSLRGKPGRAYLVFPNDASFSTGDGTLFNFPSTTSDVDIDFAGSSLHVTYPGNIMAWPFYLNGCRNIEVRRFKGKDDFGIRPFNPFGLVWGVIINGARNIRFLDCYLDGGRNSIVADNDPASPDTSPSDITVTGYFTNLYYGPSCQGGGDNMKLDVECHKVGRAGIFYNARGVRGRIKTSENSHQAVYVTCYYHPNGSSYTEVDLDICYEAREDITIEEHLFYITCQQHHSTLVGGQVHIAARIHLDVNLTGDASLTPAIFGMDSYTIAGGAQFLGTPSAGHFVQLDLSGAVRGTVSPGANFMQFALAAGGWGAPSAVRINMSNFTAIDTTRPIAVGAQCLGAIERTCYLPNIPIVREGTPNPVGFFTAGHMVTLTDAMPAPVGLGGLAQLYVDVADGDLKVAFGDGTVKTITVDT